MKRIGCRWTAAILATLLVLGVQSLGAQTRVTFKSAKSSSSYYQMAVQIAQAIKKGSQGNIIVTLEESQGSVQNVKEAGRRKGNYLFTTPPALVKLAQAGKKMFKDKKPKYQEIRSLFLIPSLTMHFVVSEKSGVKTFADLKGKRLLIGKGSFGAREAAKYVELFGLKGEVKLIDTELNNAVPALKNGQIDGFATAGSYPAPNVIEAAAGAKVRLLNFSSAQIAQTKRAKLVIPAGTYGGIDSDITTMSLVVGAYATMDMDEETAYQLTKNFWEQKAIMGKDHLWWSGVKLENLNQMGVPFHPGALRYYKEIGLAGELN
ncbi:MAG: TAXI family TRAP transporter solute-binding subunit [Desulfovibrionales bacterium]|nr:TAXI family TRAP transporter solute-binding subunit [Desulfovibrionales bacterium]